MDQKNNESFCYSYSAREQEEIRRIREKYQSPEERETKMDRLRRLDQSVSQKATVRSLVLGVLSSLVMGTGMSMCMVFTGVWFIPGIIIGCIGLAGVCLAYPLYLRVLHRERARIAPEILALTEELMQ
ncbi:MAG: hypothetical protein IJZ39_01490 [Oscillospiraceae bacterium]|nr:hypothetical protein [Oscillospiraceae bacterium]